IFGMKTSSREVESVDFIIDNLNYPEKRTNYETKVSYAVPLFTGFKLDKAKQMAKLQVKAQEAKYTFDKKQLELEVLQAYNGAVTAKEFIVATKKAKQATASFVNLANKLYQEGLTTDIDVAQAQVYDLNVNSKMKDANNRFDLAIAYLKFLTNDNQIVDVNNFAQIVFIDNDLQKLQDKAIDKRDDLSWMKYNTKTMKEKIDFESANQYPTIGMHLEYGYNNDNIDYDTLKQDYYIGVIGLKYNLFDGGLNSSLKQRAKINYNKTKIYFNQMKDGINLEIEKNLLTLLTKQEIYKEKQKAIILAKKILKKSEIMYKNSLINMSNLLSQQALLQKARAEMIMAKFDVSIATAKLKISCGESLELKGEQK
ncbi:MAG: TolC family protein, partial [Arcobacteraceae bacterium]|nr:TolC family protein [Arcobacteraceae bacterium]